MFSPLRAASRYGRAVHVVRAHGLEIPTLLEWGQTDARSPLSVPRHLEQSEAFDEAVRRLCLAHAGARPG